MKVRGLRFHLRRIAAMLECRLMEHGKVSAFPSINCENEPLILPLEGCVDALSSEQCYNPPMMLHFMFELGFVN